MVGLFLGIVKHNVTLISKLADNKMMYNDNTFVLISQLMNTPPTDTPLASACGHQDDR